MSTQDIPSNARVSNHPCLQAKVSQLRNQHTNGRDTKQLVHDIALIVGTQALQEALDTKLEGQATSHIGYTYDKVTLSPSRISIVPILRSGLSMVDAIQCLLPDQVPVFHLGMYREKSTLQPVEYYNNLPYHNSSTTAGAGERKQQPSDLAILVDPIIATGHTAIAAIDSLRDWGVKRILLCSVLASRTGLQSVADVWPEGVTVWVGVVDPDTDDNGMIKPGLGDLGDRLFATAGK